EWAWIFDYDPTVIHLHHVLRVLVLASETPAELVTRFAKENAAATVRLLDEAYQGHPHRAAVREVYLSARAVLFKHFSKRLIDAPPDPAFGWLENEGHYRYLRTMFQHDRIDLKKGDMLAQHTMQDIGAAARALGVVVRVYYPSNAPEVWEFTQQYRDNVRGLPFDERSVVITTVSGLRARGQGPRGPRGQGPRGETSGYWHYHVQGGLWQQSLLGRSGVRTQKQLVYDHVRTDAPDLSFSGLPGS
ncbi:MAG TPA: hypothetical protein VFX50_18645, partial [Gemmatimonadales bacterium]|nr:hypothetical protein [Gemmatimonadales bacterium]